jgi:hypothetical protein
MVLAQIAALDETLHCQPFQPFRVYLTDGRIVDIRYRRNNQEVLHPARSFRSARPAAVQAPKKCTYLPILRSSYYRTALRWERPRPRFDQAIRKPRAAAEFPVQVLKKG